jgi:hypothetical protein
MKLTRILCLTRCPCVLRSFMAGHREISNLDSEHLTIAEERLNRLYLLFLAVVSRVVIGPQVSSDCTVMMIGSTSRAEIEE